MYQKNSVVFGKVEWQNRPGVFDTQTVEIPQSLGKDADGKKIVKSGTVFPSNGAQAKGLVLHDIDVTNGPVPGAILTHGYVNEDRLPEKVSDEAKTALKLIQFQ